MSPDCPALGVRRMGRLGVGARSAGGEVVNQDSTLSVTVRYVSRRTGVESDGVMASAGAWSSGGRTGRDAGPLRPPREYLRGRRPLRGGLLVLELKLLLCR